MANIVQILHKKKKLKKNMAKTVKFSQVMTRMANILQL